MKKAAALMLVFCLLATVFPAMAEAPVDLDALLREIDKEAGTLAVGELSFDVSEDRLSVFINRPKVTGSDDYTIAYNIYDADSNPVNYFYSLEDRVAATPGCGGLFNVFVVVTDRATGEQVTRNIGWHQLIWPYAASLTVGRASFAVSSDNRSVFIDRPEIACRSGEVSIAYNIYDSLSNPVNYFYSSEKRVAATPGYDGRFNVFIVVTDTITGEKDIQNIGWLDLGDPAGDQAAVTGLQASAEYLFAGETSSVLFHARSEVRQTIRLADSGSLDVLGVMHDDGRDGDAAAGDGVYSLLIDLNIPAAQMLRLAAVNGPERSNTLELPVYRRLTADPDGAAQNIETVREIYLRSGAAIAGNGGSLTISAALDQAEQEICGLVQTGQVLWYERNAQGILAKTGYGLSMAFVPEVKGTDLNGDTSKMRVYALQPCESMYTDERASLMDTPREAAYNLADTIRNYTHSASDNRSNAHVTRAQVRSIGANSVVIWHGHGGFFKSSGPHLLIGEKFSVSNLVSEDGYYDDCVANRIIHCWGSLPDGRIGITGKYISHYCGDMTNSFIYLAACSSGQTDQLASAFLGKGAAAVVGNTDSIRTDYNLAMVYAIFYEMTRIDPDTNEYKTLEKALEDAANRPGMHDDGDSTPAAPWIFGGTSAHRLRLGVAGRVKGTVTASDDGKPVAGVKVRADGGKLFAVTDADGKYEIGVGEEETVITFEPGTNEFQQNGELRVTVPYRETVQRDIVLPARNGTFSGHIYDEETGEPLEGATVTAYGAGGSAERPDGSSGTAADGWFLMTLKAGQYTVEISKPGYSTRRVYPVTISRGGNTVMDFRLGPEVWVITFDPQGGTVAETTRLVPRGQPLGPLPVPQRPLYTFNHWYAASYAIPVTADDVPEGDMTLRADWTYGVTLGRYEQDNDLSNGPEPIHWRVSKVDGRRALLYSETALDVQPYHRDGSLPEDAGLKWSSCDLRRWLNEDFLKAAFNDAEAGAILTTTDTMRGTEDKVFLAAPPYNNPSFCTCEPSAYALARGAHVYQKHCSYWLRDCHYAYGRWAADIIDYSGNHTDIEVDRANICIRPAIWVDLDSGMV